MSRRDILHAAKSSKMPYTAQIHNIYDLNHKINNSLKLRLHVGPAEPWARGQTQVWAGRSLDRAGVSVGQASGVGGWGTWVSSTVVRAYISNHGGIIPSTLPFILPLYPNALARIPNPPNPKRSVFLGVGFFISIK